MKKNRLPKMTQGPAAWRRWSAGLAMLCAVGSMHPLYAAPPASAATDEANLNFVGADIESVIKAIGHYTNITFIIDPRVKGTINLVSEKPVSKAQAFNLLTSALRLQGYTVVTGEGFTKVVPEADAKLQAGPTQVKSVRGDQIATQIFHLNYESAVSLSTVLRPLISPNNTINANVGNNSLVITDYADNLRRLGKIIAALDGPGTVDLDVVPIRYAIASDIATMVNRLLEPGAGGGGGADSGRVSLLADSRTNSVIVRAPSTARANLAKSLIAKLDQQTTLPGNVHVVHLRNADAVKLAQTLRAVVSSDTSTPSSPSSASSLQPAASGGGIAASSAPATPSAPAALSAGGAAGFIQADPSTNTLIITASEAVYRNLRAVIDQLDSRRAQVYIEALIVEVTSDKAAEFGIQWAALSGDGTSNYRVGGATGFSSLGNNLIAQAAAKAAASGTPLVPGNGLSVGIFRQINGALSLGAIAHALETDDNANILSMPNLITLDNEEAKIIVGQNVPFITGSFSTPSSGSAGANPFQTIERKDVGLSLRVRPQVSEGGSVKLVIYQESSSVRPSSNASDIITDKRSIETSVLADDGQIIVLGGLIDDKGSDTVEKVPGLGDIPIVGGLFKYQKRGRIKRNLMVFLRPTVIRSDEKSVNVAGDRYDYIRNTQMDAQPERTLVLPNMGGSILPQLQNGRISGGPLYNADRDTKDATQQPASPSQPATTN
jgi:general secretion pathway protein D